MDDFRACEKKRSILKILLRIVIIILCILLFGALTAVGISEFVRFSVKNRVFENAGELSNAEDIECVVVLGAGLKADGTPSHMLEDRIKVGVNALDITGAGYILMSGDRSSVYYDEPAAMKKYAEEMGVDPSKILLDNSGFSTYESMTRVADEYGFSNIVVITQEYHLYRALYIADNANVNAMGVSADLRPYSGQIVRDIREILARVKDFFMCI